MSSTAPSFTGVDDRTTARSFPTALRNSGVAGLPNSAANLPVLSEDRLAGACLFEGIQPGDCNTG